MYIDKPMRGHFLLQAIARVNPVFRDKPAGLIVDYITIAQNLKSSLGQYSRSDQEQAGIDVAEAVAALPERWDVVRVMFHVHDYAKGLTGSQHQRLVALAEALNWIFAKQDEAAKRETEKEVEKAAHRRYQDLVLALSKAFALCSASDLARAVRDEVGFFQTVRAAMVKAVDISGQSAADRDLAIRQIVNGAVASTEIVDLLSTAGHSCPDISILSYEFLAEVGQMEKKILALEALKNAAE